MTDAPDGFSTFMRTHADASLRADAQSHSTVVCSADKGVPVIYVSESFEAHTGYRPDEVIGQPLSILQGPQTAPKAVEKFRRLISNGEAGTVKIVNYRKDGSAFVHECVMRPIRDDTGTVTHFVAIQKPAAV